MQQLTLLPIDTQTRLAAWHGFDTEAVAMKNTHHAKMTELLIGKNLDWMRYSQSSEGLS